MASPEMIPHKNPENQNPFSTVLPQPSSRRRPWRRRCSRRPSLSSLPPRPSAPPPSSLSVSISFPSASAALSNDSSEVRSLPSKPLYLPTPLYNDNLPFPQDSERTAHMHRKVLRLSASLFQMKAVNLQLVTSTSRELVEDPFKSMERSQRWKIRSAYGDAGLKYMDDETIAYVASRMPAVYSACYRVLRELRRRLPRFAPRKVLDFGAGTGSAFW